MEDGNQVGGLFGGTFGLMPNSVLYSSSTQSKAGLCIQGAWRGTPKLFLSRPNFHSSADTKKCNPWCGWKVFLCRGLSDLEH